MVIVPTTVSVSGSERLRRPEVIQHTANGEEFWSMTVDGGMNETEEENLVAS